MGEKTLVAYVSAGGATEEYARVVAERLESRGRTVDVVDLKKDKIEDLSQYGSVVLGTGVRVGMVYRKGKAFLRRDDLRGKPLAVFLASGIAIGSPEKSKAKFLTPLVRKLGLEPVAYDAFPGKVPGSSGKPLDDAHLEAAGRWAEELAERLGELE